MTPLDTKPQSQKDKMLAGELYDANFDAELIAEREYCKGLCFEYAQLHPARVAERRQIIRQILGYVGSNFIIEPSFYCDYGYNISIGNNFYSNHHLVILDAARVTIGDNVFIGPNCSLYTAGHPLDVEQRNAGLEYARPISIGDNVWLGGNVTILPGVSIGSNTTIGAGSLVTHNIPSNVLAMGSPCRTTRTL